MSETDIKRITPDEIKAAYDKTGLTVGRVNYISDDKTRACGLGAYAVANLGVKAPRNGPIDVAFALHRAGIDGTYRQAFADAFDGEPPARTTDVYLVGYEDGKAAREAVKGA